MSCSCLPARFTPVTLLGSTRDRRSLGCRWGNGEGLPVGSVAAAGGFGTRETPGRIVHHAPPPTSSSQLPSLPPPASPSDRIDEYTLKWPTDDGLQRLTQSRRETSSSSTDDGLDVYVLLEMGTRWANKSLWYDELQKFRCVCEERRLGVHFLSSVASYSNACRRLVATTRRRQELLKGLVNIPPLKIRWD